MEEIFILSCADAADGGGIYKYGLSGGGKLTKICYMPCEKPMYAAKCGGRLHILLRSPFAGGENSGYFNCREDFTGLSPLFDTLGRCACHLCADNDVYIANYLTGNIVKNCEKAVCHSGAGANLLRQEGPHTHFAGFSPDKKHILCCDLGLDCIFVYDGNLKETGRAFVPSGYGVRHIAFSADGNYFYAVNELVPSVSVFSFKNGRAELLETYALRCRRGSTAAAIKPDGSGKKLYVSVRGENAVFVFEARGEKLAESGKFASGGQSPRDIGLFGGYCVCANGESNSVCVVDLKNGYKQTDVAILKNPLCII